jgi:hypothetical protein
MNRVKKHVTLHAYITPFSYMSINRDFVNAIDMDSRDKNDWLILIGDQLYNVRKLIHMIDFNEHKDVVRLRTRSYNLCKANDDEIQKCKQVISNIIPSKKLKKVYVYIKV